jgi:hypothetical protein
MVKIEMKFKGIWYKVCYLSESIKDYSKVKAVPSQVEDEFEFLDPNEKSEHDVSEDIAHAQDFFHNHLYNAPITLSYWRNIEEVKYYFPDFVYHLKENPHLKKLGVKQFYLYKKIKIC